jgi:hypothetical protein
VPKQALPASPSHDATIIGTKLAKTVQVIGEAAFGVKFDVFEKDAAGRITEGPIVAAAKYVLENTAAGDSSAVQHHAVSSLDPQRARELPTCAQMHPHPCTSGPLTAILSLLPASNGGEPCLP